MEIIPNMLLCIQIIFNVDSIDRVRSNITCLTSQLAVSTVNEVDNKVIVG